jgi:hypothetical protein
MALHRETLRPLGNSRSSQTTWRTITVSANGGVPNADNRSGVLQFDTLTAILTRGSATEASTCTARIMMSKFSRAHTF